MNKLLNSVDAIKSWWFDLDFTPFQKRAMLIIAIVITMTSTIFLFNGRTQVVAAVEPPAPVVVAPDIIVDVAGAVARPGVYTLPTNSRVVDAIKSAGGLTKGADASDVNQARILKDGEQIYIYGKNTSFSIRASIKRISGPISINRATAKEFESLQGIGPVLAKRIVTYRKEHGSFSTIEDLLNVPGIGESTFAKFKSKIRV